MPPVRDESGRYLAPAQIWPECPPRTDLCTVIVTDKYGKETTFPHVWWCEGLGNVFMISYGTIDRFFAITDYKEIEVIGV